MNNLSIEKLKRLPIQERNPADIYDSDTFYYVDDSNEYEILCDIYFVFNNGDQEIISGLKIDNSQTTKEEYLENLRLEMIELIYGKIYSKIFREYDYLLKDIKENAYYDIEIAFPILMNSKDLSEEDKNSLKEYKVFLIDLQISKITKECAPLKEMYMNNECSDEDNENFHRFRKEVDVLKSQIEKIIYLYQTRKSI